MFVDLGDRLEVVLHDLMPYLKTQDSPLDHRMVVVKASIDASCFHFFHQVIGSGERMGGVSDEAVDGELHVRRPEIPFENGRDGASDTAVRSGILRMSRSCSQRSPGKVAGELRIAASRPYRGYRAPKTERILGIPAANDGVREATPKHRHEARGVRSIERFQRRQVAEGPRVLLAGVFGPKKSDFGLLWRPDSAIESTERLYLSVVIDPNLAVESVGTFVWEKLGGAGHSERHHVPEPRRDRRRKRRRGVRGEPWAYRGRVGNVGEQAIMKASRNQSLRSLFSDCRTRGDVCGRIGN